VVLEQREESEDEASEAAEYVGEPVLRVAQERKPSTKSA